MPHDKNGTLINVGDRILIEAVVTQIQSTDDYCNLSAESVEVMYPGTAKTSFSLNAKQVVNISAEVARKFTETVPMSEGYGPGETSGR